VVSGTTKGTVKSKIEHDISRVVDFSRMSQWSEEAVTLDRKYKPSQIADNLRVKDKETLIEELVSLKQDNNL